MSNITKRITIGITAHVDAGKTTLSESILYLTGELKKPGRVDHGDAFLDDASIERERGITVFSQQAHFRIGEATEVTLIDTPGHVDFSAETERAFSVLDYALLVVSAPEGIRPHTKALYRMLRKKGIPVFVFVNKMDISIKTRDVLIEEIAEDLCEEAVDFGHAAERSEKFIDNVTLRSAELAEAVLENMSDDAADAEGGSILTDGQIAEAVSAGEIVPVMFGSALRNEGVEEQLDVLGRYTKESEYKEAFGAKVYKTMTARDGEKLCFIKITGGELRVRDRVIIKEASAEDAGMQADAGSQGQAEVREAKVNQIRFYSGGRYEAADSAGPGAVCAVTGLGRLIPGSALGDEEPDAAYSSEPFMSYTVEAPPEKNIHEVMADMQVLSAEDPALHVSWSEDGSAVQIRIMGQVQREILQSVIRERFGYEVSFTQGRVLYLETIDGVYEGVGHFEPLRHYAEVHLIIEPAERGSGILALSEVSEDDLDLNWQRLIMTHLLERAHAGVLTGSPLTDVKISIAAGRAHAKHTVGGDFREATYRAIRSAMMQARRDGKAVLLEPWCEYEIELPAGSVGRALTDIKQMGGVNDGLEQKGENAVISGKAPSAEIAQYQQTLTGYTSGAGRLQITQCGYDVCHDAAAVIEEKGYDPERDTENPADSVFVNHKGSDIVRWDEVTEHMHIQGVLEKRRRADEAEAEAEAGAGAAQGGAAMFGRSRMDVREEAEQKAAYDKELRRIFERTYGPAREKHHIEKKEKVFGRNDGLSEEEIARNAARGEEIRSRHESRAAAKAERSDEEPLLVIVDGYNLIFADEELKELAARDIGSARDDLVERLANYAGYTGTELRVVFDAYKVVPGDGSTEDYDSISVIYTAANEPADIRIGRMVGEEKGRRIYTVSSDELVQQDAWTKGAMRISSCEFIEMLVQAEEEIRERLKNI